MSKHPVSIIQACLRCFADCFQITHVKRVFRRRESNEKKVEHHLEKDRKRTDKFTFNIVDHFSVDGLCVPFTCMSSFLCALFFDVFLSASHFRKCTLKAISGATHFVCSRNVARKNAQTPKIVTQLE